MDTNDAKKIPLHDEHVRLGGKMVPFGGYMMGVQYPLGILKEHKLVREKVGLFDISHMGEVLIDGPDAEAYLQKLMSNDLKLMVDGKAQYACMCYENGTVVDDCFYYRYSPTHFRVIINASNREKDWTWFNKFKEGFDITIENQSASRGRFALQGPLAQETLNPLVPYELGDLKRFRFIETKIGEIDVFIARTGYTGEDGFEISFAVEDSKTMLDTILKAGEKYGISLIGLGARDTLRLEACYSLYGHEINDKITPIEASIGFCVKDKEMDFNGKEVLLDQKKNGTSRKIVGVELIGRGIIRDHYKVYDASGETEIGFITSGTFSPTLKKSISLAMLNIDYTKIGTEVTIEVRNKKLKAITAKTPFYVYKGRSKK